MKRILSALICVFLTASMFPVVFASAEPLITSYGFLGDKGGSINAIISESSVRAYADISNPNYASNENLGMLWLECYVDGVLFNTKSVVLLVDANTVIKRMTTNPIDLPAGRIVFKTYITHNGETTYPEMIMDSEMSEIPNSQQDGVTYANEIDIVKAMGLMTWYEDGTFRASESITRAEFAAILTRFAGKEFLVEDQTGDTAFSDVNALHWASGYINIVTKLGLMDGFSGKFMPNSKLTMEQAAIAFVTVLGYSYEEEPLGPLDKANTIGVTTGTNLIGESLISRGTLAKLLINSLEVPLMIDGVVEDGNGNSAFLQTTLSNVFSMAKVKVAVTRLYELDSAEKAQLVKVYVLNSYKTRYSDFFEADRQIDINVGTTKLKGLVGLNALLYVVYDELATDAPIAVYAKREAPSDYEITVLSYNIDAINIDYNDIATVDYYESDTSTRTKKVTINNNAVVYVNGYIAKNSSVENEIDNCYGTITFLLTNNATQEDYDTVLIKSYTNMVVDEVSTSSGRVIGKEGISSIIFKESNTDHASTLVDKDGNTLEWSTLKENDVLSVQRVIGSSRIVNICTLVNKVVTGLISEISCDGDYTKYTIGKKSYKVDNQITYSDDLNLEYEGRFYLDILGNITYFKAGLAEQGVNLYLANDFGVANATYENTSDFEINPVLVLAQYENGRLINVSNSQKKIEPNSVGMLKNSFTTNLENSQTVKAMFFDGLENMKPLLETNQKTVMGQLNPADSNSITAFNSNISAVNSSFIEYLDAATQEIKTVNLAAGADFFINGVECSGEDMQNLNCFYGETVFQDKREDGKYRKVFVSDYINLVVGYVDLNDKTLYLKNSNAISFSDDNIDVFWKLCDEQGNKVQWSDLERNDILTTKVTYEGMAEIYVATVCRNRIDGTISETCGKTLTIGQNEYEVDNVNIHTNELQSEDSGVFCLDKFGKIAYFENELQFRGDYAYIIAAGSSGSISPYAQIKMFTYAGEVAVFDCAQTVKVSYYDASAPVGKQYITQLVDSMYLLDNENFANGTADLFDLAAFDFITYGVNSVGKINKISFPDEANEGNSGVKTFAMYKAAATANYNFNIEALDIDSSKVYITNSTIIMQAPKSTNEDDYMLIPLSALIDDFYGWANVSAYDVNKDKEAGAILIQGDVDLTSGSNGIAMVIKTSSAKNIKGNTIGIITALQNGNKNDLNSINLLCDEGTDYDVNLADIIVPEFNNKGEVKGYTKIAVLDSQTSPTKPVEFEDNIQLANAKVTAKVKFTLGKVIARRSNRITLDSGEDVFIPASANVYAFDANGSIAINKVFAPEDRYDIFSIEKDGKIYNSDGDVLNSVYVLVREYDDVVVDVVFYMFNA